MVGVVKEEEGEEHSKEEWQGAEAVFCEQGVLKNAAYEQQEEQSDAENVLVQDWSGREEDCAHT